MKSWDRRIKQIAIKQLISPATQLTIKLVACGYLRFIVDKLHHSIQIPMLTISLVSPASTWTDPDC